MFLLHICDRYLFTAERDAVVVRVKGKDDHGKDGSVENATVRIRNSASNVLKNPELRTMIAQSVHGDTVF